ncbi:MAG: glycosyltransferase [Oscillospiraceae bacterium]|nr:glycosyltransferase [Oscillospiraceae bacterium]
MLLHTIAAVAAAAAKLIALWLLITSLFFWKKTEKRPACAPTLRFACLIPARNEERVIASLIESLKAQRYPGELFDIYVAANNCTDGTEAAARAAGARVIRCRGTVRCKGDALRQAISLLMPCGYDAFCVFDADNTANEGFLSAMNDALLSGAGVAKARTVTKNAGDTWVSGCYALYYGLFDSFYNPSRLALGLSAKLVGTGFAVHRRVLEKMGGWRTETIAEDAELSARCALMGERVLWAPEAVTFDEAPRTFGVSLRQRRRWVSGVMDVADRTAPALAASLAGRDWARRADVLAFTLTPYARALSAVAAALLALSASGNSGFGVLPAAAVSVALGFAGLAALGAVLARCVGLRGWSAVKTVLLFPVFMASWLPLQLFSCVHRVESWQTVRHGLCGAAGKTPRRAE